MRSRLVRVTLGVLPAFLTLMVGAVLASPQGSPALPQVLNNPEVNRPVHFDVSPPLTEMAAQVRPPESYHAPVVLRPKLELLNRLAAQGQGSAPDGALQTSIGPAVVTSSGLNLLGVGNGFPNYTVPDAPSDVNLAVGDTQVVQWVNVSYAVFNKSTGAIVAGPIAGNAFWSGFGGTCQSSNSGDMIAQWDKLAHRWVMTQPVFSSPYMTCIAISTTPDATGTYYRFAFPQSAGFPDYPKWGLMPDAYYQSQNVFNNSGTAFLGVNVCAYERAKLLAGDPTAKQVCLFDNSNGTLFDDSLLPADLDSASNPPAAGQDEVFLGSIDNATSGPNVYEYLFHADFITPSNSKFTGVNGSMPVAVASYSLACGSGGACIPQQGTNSVLDSLGDRLMYRLAYRNVGTDHQTWLVSHSVTAGSSVGERWYEFHAPENSTSLSVSQQGTFAPDSNFRWMGSLAMDQNQDIALGYSVSSSSMFPSISYTGRTTSDAPGTMETEAQIVVGTGSQVATSNRWGDYTSMAIDAADDCTFWYTNQYYMTTAQFDWSTRLASFKFTNCGSTTPDFSLSATPSSQTVVEGSATTYAAKVTPKNGYAGTVNLTLSGCPSNATCSLSPTSSGSPSYPSSTLTVSTTSSTPTGTFTLTITGMDGTFTHATSVSLVVNAPPNFSLSASPSSQTVVQGANTSYTATVSPLNGYSGTVTFSVASGCPSNATCTFSPLTVTMPPSGNSTLTVGTTSSTPTGTFTITISVSDGSLTHTTTVTLVVNAAAAPDFSITAAPGSRTVRRGSPATYTVTITPSGGFTGAVAFTVSGVPPNSTASFSPLSVTGSGSSTMTVTTSKSTPTGSFTLTITGTSGSLSHSTAVGLKTH